MIQFQYDTLVNRENICDRKDEISRINKLVEENNRIIIYAPRRYGKTSIIKNVIAADFQKQKKTQAVLFANFMGVDSIEAICDRLQESLSQLVTRITPAKSWVKAFAGYFRNLSVSVHVDSLTGQPSLEIKGKVDKPEATLGELFYAIGEIRKRFRLLVVFDEFQDIVLVRQAEALIRQYLQEINNDPVIILGSKRKLLEKMFATNRSPLFGYGQELHFNPISAADWLPYFNERLIANKSSIAEEALKKLLFLMCDVPNSICEVGFWLKSNCFNSVIDVPGLLSNLDTFVESKEQSCRFQISLMTSAEKSVFKEIARRKFVDKITAGAFLKSVQPGASATKKIVDRLVEKGFLEWEFEKGYRISDPVLSYFICRKAF